MSRGPRPWTVLALLLGVVVLAAHGPVIVGGLTWSDPRYQTEIVPARLAVSEAIADGRLPGWWERAGLGAPLWAEPAHAAAYPGWWPAAVAPSRAAWTLDVLAILHVWWAGLGVALLARRLGADDLGALVAGALFAASDVATGALVAGGIGAVAHLAWAAWAGDVVARATTNRQRLGGALALAAAVAAIGLAGRAVLAIDAAALALAVAAARASRRGPALAWCGGAIGLAAALAAFAWLPALLHVSGDVARPDAVAATPWALLELVIPHAGRLGDGAGPGVYLGGAALLFAVVAAAEGGEGRRALAAVAAALGLAGAIAAPEHLAPAAVLIAALGGAGFARLAARRPDRRILRAVAVAGGALVVIVAALAAARPVLARALEDRGGGLDEAVARVDAVLGHGAAAVAVALGALALLFVTLRRPWPAAVPAAAVLVVAHAVIVGRLAHPHAPRHRFERPALIAGHPESKTGLSPRLYRPARMDDDDALFPTLGAAVPARFGLAAARWAAPGRRRAEDVLWTASGTAGGRLFDRYAIDLAIVPASVTVAADLPVLGERAGWALVDTRSRRPRAFLAPRWRWFDDDAAVLAALFPPPDREGLPLGTVARIGDGDGPPADAVAALARCDVRAERPERIVVHCDGGGGLVVLADAWAPGWSASIDGAAARPVERVDLALRAVAVPPGSHDVVFSYAPPGAAAGRWISLAGLVALLAALAVLLRWRR